MRTNFKIESWTPREHGGIQYDREEGTVETVRYEDECEVRIFTYAGGKHGRPFTTLKTYRDGRIHLVQFQKCYHPRWFGRLASKFSWQVAK